MYINDLLNKFMYFKSTIIIYYFIFKLSIYVFKFPVCFNFFSSFKIFIVLKKCFK